VSLLYVQYLKRREGTHRCLSLLILRTKFPTSRLSDGVVLKPKTKPGRTDSNPASKICIFGRCSNREFSRFLRYLRFFTVAYILKAENLRPLGPKLRVRQKRKLLPFKSCSHHGFTRGFTFRPIRYSPIHVACWEFWSQISHTTQPTGYCIHQGGTCRPLADGQRILSLWTGIT